VVQIGETYGSIRRFAAISIVRVILGVDGGYLIPDSSRRTDRVGMDVIGAKGNEG
jgi:hypothetical protein